MRRPATCYSGASGAPRKDNRTGGFASREPQRGEVPMWRCFQAGCCYHRLGGNEASKAAQQSRSLMRQKVCAQGPGPQVLRVLPGRRRKGVGRVVLYPLEAFLPVRSHSFGGEFVAVGLQDRPDGDKCDTRGDRAGYRNSVRTGSGASSVSNAQQ
jgi:hypothetical protein